MALTQEEAPAHEEGRRRKKGSKAQAPEDVAEAVLAALLPRLERLEALHAPRAGPPPMEPSDVAAAVVGSLAPELEDLRMLLVNERRAAGIRASHDMKDMAKPKLRNASAQTDAAPPTPGASSAGEALQLPIKGFFSEESRPDAAEPSAPVHQQRSCASARPQLQKAASHVTAHSYPSYQSQASVSCKSELRSQGTTGLRVCRRLSVACEVDVLHRAFVVNFRRLMDLYKVFHIIHELIKSTAIAALTLVVAGDSWQLTYSIVFVAVLLSLYGFHWSHYDTLNVDDYRRKADLIEDDDGECNGRTISNPNRLLKALALSRRGRRRRALVTLVVFSFFCLFLWTLVFVQWCLGIEFQGMLEDFMKADFYVTLLLVGTLMLLFIICFEWLYWRETSCVMPWIQDANAPTGERRMPFDAKRHPIPVGYRWFGLPSMWFTSVEGWDHLRCWINNAQKLGDYGAGCKPFPAEMAVFALDASGGCHLRNALLHAKLYNARTKEFMTRKEGTKSWRCVRKDEEPHELDLDLVFFDSQSSEYLQPEENYQQGQVHLLQRSMSLSLDQKSDPASLWNS